MRNAFEILGATPVHTGEELKELLEEQQLLSDDEKELADAYASLTNPKKRIRHEIEYLAKEYFEPFNELFVNNAESEQQMSVSETCTAIIDLGDWFENDADYIIDEINENREISGFPSIDDDSVVSAAISELRASCVSAVIKYFDYFDESGLVAIFNALVKRDDFQSFFVDELLAHYEIKIADTLQEKQDACENSFNEIERLCNSFINGGALSSLIDGKITEFKKLLAAWDKIAQPLQVNAQHRGAAHDDSSNFVHEIRNKVIDLCNKSQESLNTLISTLQFSYTAKAQLPQKLADSKAFIEYMLKLLDILLGVFAEVEVTAEQLKKDKKDITDLKKTLSDLLIKVDPYGRAKTSSSTGYAGSTTSNNYGATSQRSRKYDSDDYGGKFMNRVLGMLILGSFIMMIATFANGIIWAGILSIVLLIGAIITAIMKNNGSTEPKGIKVVAVLMSIMFLATMIPAIAVESSSSNGSNGSGSGGGSNAKTYTITFNKNGGSGGTSSISGTTSQFYTDSISVTAPTRSDYTFDGYFSTSTGGTKYYDDKMKSTSAVQNITSNITLYAHWSEDGVALTTSNFSTYFTLSSSCSVRTSGSYYTSYYADYSYSISKKGSWSTTNAPTSITVVIGLDISSLSTSYGTPSEYKITVTLYKSSGYSASGSKSYSISSNEKYWDDGIYSVSGRIYP